MIYYHYTQGQIRGGVCIFKRHAHAPYGSLGEQNLDSLLRCLLAVSSKARVGVHPLFCRSIDFLAILLSWGAAVLLTHSSSLLLLLASGAVDECGSGSKRLNVCGQTNQQINGWYCIFIFA